MNAVKMINGVKIEMTGAEVAALTAVPAAIDSKLRAFNVYAQKIIGGGFTVTAPTLSNPSDVVFATDAQSRADLTGAYNLALTGKQPTFTWWAENGFFDLNTQQIEIAAAAVGIFIEACYKNSVAHVQAISALTDYPSVQAYDFTTGWPVPSA